MLGSPLLAWLANSFVGTRTSYVFFIETLGIWAFSAYWLIKSAELKRSKVVEHAAHGQVSIPEPTPAIRPAIQRITAPVGMKSRSGQS